MSGANGTNFGGEHCAGSVAMPRTPRADKADAIYHVLNRDSQRQQIFHEAADYEAFERVLAERLRKNPVDLICFQWMPNHWHMVLTPQEVGARKWRNESADVLCGDDTHGKTSRSLRHCWFGAPF